MKAVCYEKRLIAYSLLLKCGPLGHTAWVQIPGLSLNFTNFVKQVIFLSRFLSKPHRFFIFL